MIKSMKTGLALATVTFALMGCSQQPSSEQTEAKSTYQPIEFPEIYNDYLNRDVRDDVFYFVMPDRFYNGNPDNDNGSESIPASQGGFVIDSKWGFHGGDLQGIEQKLDYLKSLGVSAIWMTPILRNKAIQQDGYAHHGYWILDFTQIDPHFGSNENLKQLIDAAHAKGIKIFFDIITNHTADVIKYKECHNPDGTTKGNSGCAYKSTEQLATGDVYTPFILPGEENLKTPAWLNDPKYYHNQGDSFWEGESAINGDFVGLDDLNTLHPDVINGMIDIYKNIISEFKPDGFRVDTVKHVHMPFWSQFSPAIMEHARDLGIPNFHIFGEVYSADPVELSSYTTEGNMPSVLDFGFQQAAADVFYRQGSTVKIKQLFEADDLYSDADSQADLLMNFLGNHDMGRAGFFIQQSNADASEQEKLQLSKLSHAFMYLSRGIPVIYYGDEQGFTGDGGDIDSREDMFPSKVADYNDNNLLGTDATTAQDNFDQNHPLYIELSQLAELRMQHKALRYGVTFNRYFDERRGVFATSRVDSDEQVEYFAVFNRDRQEQVVTVDASAGDYQLVYGEGKFVVAKGKLEVTVPPLGYVLLKANETLPNTVQLDAELAGIENVQDRVRIDYNLSAQQQLLPMLKVRTELMDSNGQYQVVATDMTPPYSAIVSSSRFEAANQQPIRVTVENMQGQSQTHVFPLPSEGVLEKVLEQ